MDSSVSVTIAALQLRCFVCYYMFVLPCHHSEERTLKKEDHVSKQVATVSQNKEKSPEYEEKPIQ